MNMLTASNQDSTFDLQPPTDRPPAISFEEVSVRYRLPREHLSGIKEFAIRWLQRRIQFEDFWALRRVSFSVEPGEVFGIIGRNGAGKSTMLKVMAKVLKPVEGRVVMRGSVAPLLELGGGFHPELTGRENVYMNMALLGHNRSITDRAFDEIVDFAEFREFIDAPLRTYSTGMVARLGFAVATCIRPDILLVDEILSVGDSKFQAKCLDRMFTFQREGTTIIIVSHGLGALESFCKRALLLEKGVVKLVGPVDQVIQEYIHGDMISEPAKQSTPAFEPGAPPLVKEMPVQTPSGAFASLTTPGGIYPTQNIFNPGQGTISAWIKLNSQAAPQNAVLFHSDDSRYVFYISLQFSISLRRYTRRLVARAGGNRRVIDTYYGTSDFPEVGVAIEEVDTGNQYILEQDKYHLIAMTWEGYPEGRLHLYINGEHQGERHYDPRFDQGNSLANSFAIGLRPPIWTGEIVHLKDGATTDLRPESMMWIGDAGVEIKDMRLYQWPLTPEEITTLFSEGIEA
jgi:ABC-type polysaccharide/polyol phosphate transport system ATPase subunit